MSWLKDPKTYIIVVLAALCVFLWLRPGAPTSMENPEGREHGETTATQVWTCSMHPQIRAPQKGLCPLCAMDLIPANDEDEDTTGPWELKLSEHARKLADIRVAPVERKLVPREIRMVGKVTYDEKRLGKISAWVPGRIDRLFVDFTGITVEKGDHMVEMYSPVLVSAQGELMQALRTLKTGPAALQKATQRRVEAAREKLRLLGLSPEQVDAVEAEGAPRERLTINAPMGGVVITKHLKEGAYVQTGSPIYTIADLSRVWIQLDAYESDLNWLRYGQEVDFELEAYPGERLTGRIVFIDSVLDPKTHTVKVRMDVPNEQGLLKPDMFVRATAHALISPGGKVMDPSLEGKWICPMHPEVVSSEKGLCTVCEMDLERAEDLGFASGEGGEAPLLIPASAALITGERAVVYVQTEPGLYQGRVVVLGPRTNDYYVVRSGLEEGETVVVNGSFKIDSELQIRAKTSMMYADQVATEPVEATDERFEAPAAFLESLNPLLDHYFQLQQLLSKDEMNGVESSAEKALDAYKKIDTAALPAKQLSLWLTDAEGLSRSLQTMADTDNIADARTTFETLSTGVTTLLKRFGLPAGRNVYRYHCPMAFDNKGADWLQDREGTENPYYGSMMYRCGSQVEQLGKEHKHE
ncbi:MAG: efflux RND transporter periplasmic adaptor subunit [Acidobacteriota bacterium]|nr:efflux RND transporter periplasmic adaptor subunit [Acidobacteriota bacterium]